jgi:hypothetical protein
VLLSAPASAQMIRLMTGPQGGSWYPLGGAIQTIVEKNVPGTSVRVLPGAGISNVLGVETGKAEMGFGNSVSTFDGIHGNDPFKKKTDNVCHIGTLYFQYFHVVALAAGLHGYLLAVCRMWERAVLVIAALLLILPELISSLVGIALLVGIPIIQKRRHGAAPAAT